MIEIVCDPLEATLNELKRKIELRHGNANPQGQYLLFPDWMEERISDYRNSTRHKAEA
jgi:hypothetical protein